MNMSQPNIINQLIAQFLDLQEQWDEFPDQFDWATLVALAKNGADAYNEGNGPSFHILATEGLEHSEFHLRFLEYSIEAGFDPFKLVHAGSSKGVAAVFGHQSLACAATENPWSARMQACLHECARLRFGANGEAHRSSEELMQIITLCNTSLPADILEALRLDISG